MYCYQSRRLAVSVLIAVLFYVCQTSSAQNAGDNTPSTPTAIVPESLFQFCRQFHAALSQAYEKHIVNSYKSCQSELEFENQRLRNCTALVAFATFNRRTQQNCTKVVEESDSEEYLARLFESRLINSTDDLLERPSLRNVTEDNGRQSAPRSSLGIRNGSNLPPNQEVCETRSRVRIRCDLNCIILCKEITLILYFV